MLELSTSDWMRRLGNGAAALAPALAPSLDSTLWASPHSPATALVLAAWAEPMDAGVHHDQVDFAYRPLESRVACAGEQPVQPPDTQQSGEKPCESGDLRGG